MLTGTIKLNPKTNKLYIDGTLPTQKNISLRNQYIEKFNLKENDIVSYDGMPYNYAIVYHKHISSE